MRDGITRTSLTSKAALMRDPDPNGAHRMAARVWREQGHVTVLRASIDRLSWEDRAFLEALAARLYGERRK